MQTNTKPQTASPMVGLDEAHQLEVQIMNLKNLGYTMVRNAIPPLKLQEIQTAFEQKMSEQIATMGRGHRNAFNRFDLIPLWQEPVFRQLVNLPRIMPIVRGYMERYWDDEPMVFGAGHGHCLLSAARPSSLAQRFAREQKGLRYDPAYLYPAQFSDRGCG